MSRLAFFSLILITTMQSCTTVPTQTNMQIDWEIAATIPAADSTATQPGLAGACIGVTNNVLLIAGGSNFPGVMPWLGGKKKYYNDIYLFSKIRNVLAPYKEIFHLPFTTGYGASSSVDNSVVYAGGENETGLSNKVIVLKWDSVSRQLIITDLPHLPVAISNASMVGIGSNLYLAGGETAEGVSDQLFVMDTKNQSSGWIKLAPVPQPFSNAVMVALHLNDQNFLYLVGGRKKNKDSLSTLYSTVYSYDIQHNQWQKKQSMPYALSAGTGLVTRDNVITIFGGDKGAIFHKTEELIIAINAEKDETKKNQMINEKAMLQQNHPGFSKEILGYNPTADSWKVLGTFPFETQVTTTAVQFGKSFIIPCGEIKAGIRTPNVVAGKPAL